MKTILRFNGRPRRGYEYPHRPILLVDDRFLKRKQAINPLLGKPLSEREYEVLRFIALGETNKSIGHILKISIKTVEKFRGSVMKKLDLHSVADLTHYALATNICGNKFGGAS